MNEYYLAVDIGASGGLHVLGHLEGGKLVIEEMHRFENGAKYQDGHLVWDTGYLFSEICNGLVKCRAAGKIPKSMGVDTWGVDYILLDKNRNRVGKTYAYRDNLTAGMIDQLEAIYPPGEIYGRAGLQKLSFNTIYQLMAHKKQSPQDLDAASHFLMLPDYFHFLLTGEISNEYTNASTTQLIDVHTKDWDRDMIAGIGIDGSIFSPVSMPGTALGKFKPEISHKLGFSCDVVLPATHDTGSAFIAMPAAGDDSAIISSGTWSLMGCELLAPVTSPDSMKMGFTNEGGYDCRYRYLKNIMGLWMIQSVRKELPDRLSFEELSRAAQSSGFDVVVDCNDNRFLAPESMISAIRECCANQGSKTPETPGEVAAVIYNSLAACYKHTFEELAALTGKTFDSIHIVGGGARDRHLNRLTAEAAGKPVFAGPNEATAIGNIMAQMIKDGVFTNLKEARGCVRGSFKIDHEK
jgi:rhamnulokinase